MAARTSQTRDQIERNKSKNTATGKFSRRSLAHNSPETRDNQVPAWVIVVFIFALVFCLFAIYKVFIYGKGYQLSSQDHLDLPITSTQEPSTVSPEEESSMIATGTTSVLTIQTGNQEPTTTSPELDHNADIAQLQTFYQYLVNNQIQDMNSLVHRPLKNSTTWINHRNTKNINIFTKYLVDTLHLENIFFVPGSLNPTKQTRQYSYSLSYTISPNHRFVEDWKVTLLTQADGKTVISEIMCETTGCSRSPFFWPQNYGLK